MVSFVLINMVLYYVAILNKYRYQDKNKRRIRKLLHLFINCSSTLAKNMPCCCSRKMLFDKRYSLKSYKVYLNLRKVFWSKFFFVLSITFKRPFPEHACLLRRKQEQYSKGFKLTKSCGATRNGLESYEDNMGQRKTIQR